MQSDLEELGYDGLIAGYNISLGGGIRRRLNETYMAAKRNGRVIETLEPQTAPPVARAAKKPQKTGGPRSMGWLTPRAQ